VIDPFVDVAWLQAHRDEVVIADVRFYLDGRSGADSYTAGHIPGAVFVDLERALTGSGDPASSGRHPLPDAQAFTASLGKLGIGDEDTVIAYDDAGGVMAARLVWMLRATGRSAALLDGGLGAWEGELSTDVARRVPSEPEIRPWPADRLATIEDAARSAERGIALIDARQRERFAGGAGGSDFLDPRAGHIPGARSVPCRENLAADGRLKSVEELRSTFAAAGVTGGEVISYCGSGVTACHNLLTIEHAGLGAGRLFPGSWSQWSREPGRPVETGS
jgi:thiosulfate/3-mercaptopyruvate sulfurtransferase